MRTGEGSGARPRAEAARIVDAVVNRGRSLDALLTQADERVAARDRGLLRMLSYGVLRSYFRLAAQADARLRRPLARRDRTIHALLLVGLYQLTDTRVGEHAAVAATVEAARLLGRPRLAPLVNAVLRGFLRDGKPSPETSDRTVMFDHPAWLIDRLAADWPDQWEAILAANNEQAPMWLRVNARRTDACRYLELLAGRRGVAPEAVGALLAGADQAIRLAEPSAVDDLPGFAEGLVSVQDAAAQLAAPWLLVGGGSRILDACAAPGGKTAHLLELAAPDAALTAVEIDPERAASIRDNLARLGLGATVLSGDASKPEEWWENGAFDRVLVDAPCSATGVIRRHPDIKHLRRERDVDALAGLQSAILDALWPLLAPGGRLLYVTCSLLRQENDAVVEGFVRRQADARPQDMLPNNNIRALMCPTSLGFQILPGTAGLDGFYFACLEKRS